ncbi:HAMP domain-containing methyl-accepting chemotaxis protein [Baaleninema sp.]|uniref:HAMP domain-containing methyl-accepting chemotaxis protein n=1 Tax=Baaleninema sp. TaxID=3101197 RepID=UPI003CFC08DE
MVSPNNLKVRYWIIFGYLVPILLSVVSSVVVWRNVSIIREEATEVESFVTNSNVIGDLALSVQVMSRTTRGYLLDPDSTSLESYTQAKQQFDNDVVQLQDRLANEEQLNTFNTLVTEVRQLIELNDSLIALVRSGATDRAIAQWRQNNGRRQAERIEILLRDFHQREKQLIDNSQTNQDEAMTDPVNSTFAFTLLTLVVSISIGLWLVGKITRQMNESAGWVASSSSEIAATVEQQERAATQQAASVNETTTTMDELGASARQVMEQADAATSNARQALDRADNGTRAVGETLDTMNALKDKVGAIAQQILRLSEQTNQIGNISTLVSDLANQTNMLALNAAVEAVRAGEHGKGFSVVASEIRKLADQSKKSAEKINALVADIQNAINSTVMVTDEGTKTVESGVRITHDTSDAFAGVREAIDEVVLNNQQISLTLKQQVNAVQQVIEAMNSLNTAAQENASGIAQVKVGTQRLNDAALSLKEMV